jgi:hypothetical protein
MSNYDRHEFTAVAQLPAYPVPAYTIPAYKDPDTTIPGHYGPDVIDVPAHTKTIASGYTTDYPAETIYSQDFESGLDGWTALNDSSVYTASTGVTRSGTTAFGTSFFGPSNKPQATRTVTGLIVGKSYTFSAWLTANSSNSVVTAYLYTNQSTAPAATTLGFHTWTKINHTFTATASTVALYVARGAYTAISSIYMEDVTLTRDTYSVVTPPVTEEVPATYKQGPWIPTVVVPGTVHPAVNMPASTAPAGPLLLKIKAGSVTMSDTNTPYITVNLTCAMPTLPQAEAFNPNLATPIRVTVNVAQTFGPTDTLGADWNVDGYRPPTNRTFNLVLRSTTVDRGAQEMSLVLMSDEARLIDRSVLAPDYTPLTFQSSLRGVVNYCLGKIGASLSPGEDTPVVVSQSPNLFIKPSGRRGGSANSGLLGLNTSGVGQDAGVDTYGIINPNIGRGSGGLYMAELINVGAGQKLEPYTQYTYSATIYGSTTTALLYAAGPGVTNAAAVGPDVAAGAFRRSSVTFTTTGSGSITFYVLNGATVPASGTHYIAIQDAQLEKGTYASPYFDGATPANTFYTFAWQGVADASISTRVLKTPRSADLLNWMPGTDAWDFLAPIVEATGFRLWCDEAGVWKLAKQWGLKTQVNLSNKNGVKVASDTRTRNDGTYWQSVSITYKWTDSDGINRTAYDSAGTVGDLCLAEVQNTPYPGPGAAGYVLARAGGRGRVFDLQAISNYGAEPGAKLIITLPGMPIQTGEVSAVTWNFPSGDMTVKSKALTNTPPNSWVLAPPTRTWNNATGTWNTYTNF